MYFLNFYVPWDISYLDRFRTYVTGAIGTSTNIGFVIFGTVFGLALVSTVISMFTRNR